MRLELSHPNDLMLAAQARVCTGPHQSRPLGKNREDNIQPQEILELVLQSLRNEIPKNERVSSIQMGAFFAAMTLRRTFEAKTNWNASETEAFERYSEELAKTLPPDLKFLLDPTQEIITDQSNTRLFLSYLQRILRGEHLNYHETNTLLQHVIGGHIPDSLCAAALIGQRMNIENEDEVRAYLDVVYPLREIKTLRVPNLTHFGQPYNGSRRSHRMTVFVAAVRAALGAASVLHGVDRAAPKFGVTEEQILQALGARTNLSIEQAGLLIEDHEVGFAYVSQREFSPKAYGLLPLRHHIKKRPPFATTEKLQQLFSCGNNYIVAGFYHSGYETKMLRILWNRGFQAGLVIKGMEGSSFFSLRNATASTPDTKTINYIEGFKRIEGKRHSFSIDLDPKAYGFHYKVNARPAQVSAKSTAELGLSILQGQRGPEYDRLVLTCAAIDHLLGLCHNPQESVQRVEHAIQSGRAFRHLQRYIKATHKPTFTYR